MSRPTGKAPAEAPLAPRAEHGLHVAIIMDGNGRWAKQRGLPRAFGHRAGVALAGAHAVPLGKSSLQLSAGARDSWQCPGR